MRIVGGKGSVHRRGRPGLKQVLAQGQPRASVVFSSSIPGPIAMAITVPAGGTLNSRSATWTPVAGSPAAAVLGGTLASPTYTASGDGVLTLIIQWTDAAGVARTTIVGQTIAAVVVTPPAGVEPTFSNSPTISGTATAGLTLTGSEGTATGSPAPVLTVAWQRQLGTTGSIETLAGGLTSPALVEGYRYRLRATASNGVGSPVEAYSAWSDVAVAAAAPTLPEEARAGVSYNPAVAAVTLANTGALRLPEGNYSEGAARAGFETYHGSLLQPLTNLYVQRADFTHVWPAVVRLSGEKRNGAGTVFYSIYGTGTGGSNFRLAFYSNNHSDASRRGRFEFYLTGSGGSTVTVLSAPWTEEGALVLPWCNGANQWQLDWYSLRDGARYAGVPQTVNNNALSMGTAGIMGVGTATTALEYTANGTSTGGTVNHWPGEIELVAIAQGKSVPPPTDPAIWSAVALGRDIKSVLPVANANLVRRYGQSYAADPAVTGDTLPAAYPRGSSTAGVLASTILPGSTIRRQSEAAWLLIDGVSGGQVYGLKVGETERRVPITGTGAGFSGDVEVQVFALATGAVVRDWTNVGPLAGGKWGTAIWVPKSTGWLGVRARAAVQPSLMAYRLDPFAVGWKFMIMGQSQTQIGMFTGNVVNPTLVNPMSASYADLAVVGARATLGAAARRPGMARIGVGSFTDGLISFLNQLRVFDPTTPVMIYDEAVNGTSMELLLTGGIDADSDRQWADLTDKLDRWGNDVTAILWNWLMNEGDQSGADVPRIMQGAFLPAYQTRFANSLVPVLAPGWTLGVLGGDRESRATTARQGMRSARIAFAYDNGFTIGPMVSDYRIEDAGGPHPGNSPGGPARFGQRMGVLAARVLGLDSSQNPYYANARRSADGTKLLIDAIPVNGGTITSPAPTALRSWYLIEPTDPVDGLGNRTWLTAISKGASVVLNGATVEITRSSGSWPAGTQVMRMDDSEKRADGDGAAEDAIHAGGIYESWAPDVHGVGLPVIGSRDANGKWRNVYIATP